MSVKKLFSGEPLYLMDGSAFVFRGYYANQTLSRSDGFPTGALFIVGRILLRILREETPRHFAMVLDGRALISGMSCSLPTSPSARPSPRGSSCSLIPSAA